MNPLIREGLSTHEKSNSAQNNYHFNDIHLSHCSVFWTRGCQGFWSPLCMAGNCSSYNLFDIADWSLNEALTFNLLSLHHFLFFSKWLDFLKVLLFFSLFSSSLSFNQSHCLFVSHLTPHATTLSLIRCAHALLNVWSLAYDTNWNTQHNVRTEYLNLPYTYDLP